MTGSKTPSRPTSWRAPVLKGLAAAVVIMGLAVGLPAALGLLGQESTIGDSAYSGLQGEVLHGDSVRRNLAKGNILRFFETDRFNFPFGERLHFAMANSLFLFFTATLQALFGPIGGYNVFAVLILLLNFATAFLLARHFFKERVVAVFAALVFACSSYVFVKIELGFGQKYATLWLPLFVLAMVKLEATRRPLYAGLAAVALMLVMFSYPPYALYLAFATGLLALVIVVRQPERLEKVAIGFGGVMGLFLAGTLLTYAAMGFGLVFKEMRNPVFIEQPDGAVNLLFPFYFHPYVSPMFPRHLAMGISAVAFAAALLAVVKVRGTSRTLFGVFLVMLVLAAGPYLAWNGSQVEIGGCLIPLPYYVLSRYLPLFGGIFFPMRLAPIFNIFLGLSAGFGLQWLMARFDSRKALAIGCAACALLVIEQAVVFHRVFPPRVAAVELPEAFAEISDETTKAVLHLPATGNRLHINRYAFWGALRGVPMVNAYLPNDFTTELPLDGDGAPKKRKFVEDMRSRGVHYILLHHGHFPEDPEHIDGRRTYGWLPSLCDELKPYPRDNIDVCVLR
jgi:hypothetical protein